ncbi:MAG: RagB/SusD family nutrient uptake outer membrane protein [Bacteroidales bacterium]|nr:RagB/SusD family nutrient uptake outer membrane protein [Bacteroidales bacterium]MCF8391301.1 RagB/SusD family nutrient uptake outer membrane protein [Bacteroidales bacterium]
MKIELKYFKKIAIILGILFIIPACTEDLLDQSPRNEISSDQFWQSPDDAITATYGVYHAARLLFRFDYMYDGFSPYGRYRNLRNSFENIENETGVSDPTGSFLAGGGIGDNFDMTWKLCYRIVNRANYVLSYVDRMIEEETNAEAKNELRRIRGENYFLRSLAYFRLITLWGDVPYYDYVLDGNDDAYTLTQMPISDVKDMIIKDLDSACVVLPDPGSIPSGQRGRATQASAYGFRGKVKLYWASWKKNGWPEIEGFLQDDAEAQVYFAEAASDFGKVINDYGLQLFGEGDPGTYGDNDNFDPNQLPMYWHLFQFGAEYSSEIIFSVQFAGPDLEQGDWLTRGFGNRHTINGQVFYAPSHHLVNRYQLIETGDFAPPVVFGKDVNLINGAINPLTYERDTTDVNARALRDWRMKATIMWDGQRCLWIDATGLLPPLDTVELRWGDKSSGFIDYDDSDMGYIYRKWVRQEPTGGRTDGSQDFYMMRLADVFLMYAEAKNETEGPSQELVDLLNRIRVRGNLPGLAPDKYDSKESFFDAIEQERIVELNAEGHIGFDIRRWRKLEEIYPSPQGLAFYDTHGSRDTEVFLNATPQDYQRMYLFKIPPDEMERNTKLRQNKPWL